MIEDKLHDLPEGWVRVKIGDIFHLHYGKGLIKKQRVHSGDVPVYGSSGLLGYHDTPYTKKPCLIVGRKGNVGSVFLSDEPCWPIDTTYYIEIQSSIHVSFSYYLLSQKQLLILDKSTAIPGINRNDVYDLTIPLPPATEQHRIVNKIEELFTNLDAGVESLKKVQAQVKRYRQAVLKHAFEGKLTAAWREENELRLEVAPELLERINEYKNNKNAKEYEQETTHNKSIPTTLPSSWVWVKFDNVVESFKRGPFGSSIKKEMFVSSGYKVYEQKNAIYKTFKLGNYYISKDKFKELKAFEVKPLDYITSCSGTIGCLYRIPKEAPSGIINQALLRIRINEDILYPSYFSYLFESESFKQRIMRDAKGTAIKNIAGVRQMRIVPFPLCSLEEQQKIVEEIELRFSIADRVEEIVEQNLKRAEQLRQSILKKAFEGKLVPQDPTDEPASVLLERIRAEKEKSDNEKNRRKRSKN